MFDKCFYYFNSWNCQIYRIQPKIYQLCIFIVDLLSWNGSCSHVAGLHFGQHNLFMQDASIYSAGHWVQNIPAIPDFLEEI